MPMFSKPQSVSQPVDPNTEVQVGFLIQPLKKKRPSDLMKQTSILFSRRTEKQVLNPPEVPSASSYLISFINFNAFMYLRFSFLLFRVCCYLRVKTVFTATCMLFVPDVQNCSPPSLSCPSVCFQPWTLAGLLRPRNHDDEPCLQGAVSQGGFQNRLLLFPHSNSNSVLVPDQHLPHHPPMSPTLSFLPSPRLRLRWRSVWPSCWPPRRRIRSARWPTGP